MLSGDELAEVHSGSGAASSNDSASASGANASGGAPAGGAAVGGDGAGALSSGHGGAGGASGPPLCGNGAIEPPDELCDDNNSDGGDGCTDCTIDFGYECGDGEPSVCTKIQPQIVSASNLPLTVPDDESYDGTIEQMVCAELMVPDAGYASIQDVSVTFGIDHAWLGDLVIKLVSPDDVVVTLMSRPGLDEPTDTSNESNGDSSNLAASGAITFDGANTAIAEQMGSGLGDNETACVDDALCDYLPNSGAAQPGGLMTFDAYSPVGLWRLCFADGDDGDAGTVHTAHINVLSY